MFGRKLSRDTNARQALLGNLASSLLVSGQVTTTLAKAKFTKVFVEKMITKAKRDSMHSRRLAAQKLTTSAFQKLITTVGPGFKDRPGGYTRIIQLQNRRGDAAPMARIELLKFEKAKEVKSPTEKPTSIKTE